MVLKGVSIATTLAANDQAARGNSWRRAGSRRWITTITKKGKLKMRAEDHILLLDVGGEGGGLRLVLEMTDIGVFSYRLLDDSCESSFFSKEDLIQPKLDFADKFAPAPGPQPLVIDWPGALKLLDEHRWPWPALYPLFVHPSIQSLVVVALKNRCQRYPEIHFSSWERDFASKESRF